MMEARKNIYQAPVYSIPFLLFGAGFAWFWTASSLHWTYPWLVSGDRGARAMISLCMLSFLPAGIMYLITMWCAKSSRAIKVLAVICSCSIIAVALLVLLLFVLPYNMAGAFASDGLQTFTLFPEIYAPYSWAGVGDAVLWLALTLVFPWGPYLASLSLAGLLFSLTYGSRTFKSMEKLFYWGLIVSCVTLFVWIMPLWWKNLVWFYDLPS